MYIKQKKKDDFTMLIVSCMLGLTLLIVLLFFYAEGISGNDFWWHVKTGEWICENRSIPDKDIFSWYGSEQGFSWNAHEWLSEVILYKIFVTFGQKGIYLFSLVMAIGLVAAVVAITRNNLKNNVYITIVFLGMFTVVTRLYFYGRPHIFSFYLLLLELKILYDFYEDSTKKCIWFLPLIACLWSNLHGGSSSMAYLLPMIFLIVSLCRFAVGKVYVESLSKKAVIVLAVVTILTFFSLTINPSGFDMIIYPYANMGDELMQASISEWAAPDAKKIGQLVMFFAPMAMMSLGIVCTEKKIRLIDLILMLFFMFLFFRSIRFIMLWYIAAVFFSFSYIPQYDMKCIKTKLEKLIAILAVCILLVFLGMSFGKVLNVAESDSCISTAMSDEAINAVLNDQPERVFNDYNLGETLIYHDVKVFFDARADIYSKEGILKEGIELMSLISMDEESDIMRYVDVNEMLEKYQFDAVLIQKNRPLYVYIKSHPETFVYVYEDTEIAYYRVR